MKHLALFSIFVCPVVGLVPRVSFRQNAAAAEPGVSKTTSCRMADDLWQGDVVSTPGGTIQGCAITAIGEEPTTIWEVKIDGVEADLGKFSEAIYKKIVSDAKQQRFQGFRPGTIPPHLEPTYRAFSMDECARETVLEAMQQNNIRPFSTAREDVEIVDVSIPPPPKKNKGKKKSSKKKKGMAPAEESATESEVETAEPQWRSFENMKGAIDAGWRPGQSFSFVAKNARGQKVLGNVDVEGAKPLGAIY